MNNELLLVFSKQKIFSHSLRNKIEKLIDYSLQR